MHIDRILWAEARGERFSIPRPASEPTSVGWRFFNQRRPAVIITLV